MPASPNPSSKPRSDSAVPDVLAPDLRGSSAASTPGGWSAAAGAHFANPRNDFWRLLHDAGFTPRLLGAGRAVRAARATATALTNAACRTTPGSGDLRRGDFAGAAERLERDRARSCAREGSPSSARRPTAARSASGRSSGVQERRLGETLLFVLPSTSPANAAVPYDERLRWFEIAALAGRSDLAALAAPAVRDRRAPVAAERLRAQLHARAAPGGACTRPGRSARSRGRRRRGRSRRSSAPRASGPPRRRPRAPGRARRRAGASPRRAGRRAARRSARAR